MSRHQAHRRAIPSRAGWSNRDSRAGSGASARQAGPEVSAIPSPSATELPCRSLRSVRACYTTPARKKAWIDRENAMRPTMKLWCAAVLATILALPAQAQDYPNKPVTFITPAAAGNSPDVVTRIVADKLTQIWKQQIVIINRPGAGGLIAAQAAAASSVEKDGYTLYMTQASTYTVLPVMQEGKMGVNLEKAFTPIGMVGEQPIAVSVNKDVPVKTVAELIAYAAKSKEPMLFGATNRGGQSHLTGELLRKLAKANISFVHAAAATVSLNDVIAGRIPIMFEGLAGLAPALQGDSVK